MAERQRRFTRQELLAFLGLIFLLFVSQFLAQEAAAFIETIAVRMGVWSPRWAAGISFVTLCAVVWLAHAVTRSQPRLSDGGQQIICAVAFVVVVLSNAAPGWMAAGLGVGELPFSFRSAVSAAVCVVWVMLWYRMLPRIKQWFEAPVDLVVDSSPVVPVGPLSLIALISKISSDELDLPPHPATACLRRGAGYLLTFASLEQDIAGLNSSNWPWQQLLRAVHRYAPRPDLRIILIGSGPGDSGSHAQLMLCKTFLERYPEIAPDSVGIFPHPLDFEDFNQVKKRVRECIREECRRVGEGKVFVDITGGQKVASAAAAAATIGAMGQFQYVRTNEPWTVIVSDLHPQAVPAAGG